MFSEYSFRCVDFCTHWELWGLRQLSSCRQGLGASEYIRIFIDMMIRMHDLCFKFDKRFRIREMTCPISVQEDKLPLLFMFSHIQRV